MRIVFQTVIHFRVGPLAVLADENRKEFEL